MNQPQQVVENALKGESLPAATKVRMQNFVAGPKWLLSTDFFNQAARGYAHVHIKSANTRERTDNMDKRKCEQDVHTGAEIAR